MYAASAHDGRFTYVGLGLLRRVGLQQRHRGGPGCRVAQRLGQQLVTDTARCTDRQKPERSCIDRPSGDRREGLGSEGSFGEQGGDDCHPNGKTHGGCFAADGASAAAAPSAEVSGVFDDFETASADFSAVFFDGRSLPRRTRCATTAAGA